jgi:WD40 repeat protein
MERHERQKTRNSLRGHGVVWSGAFSVHGAKIVKASQDGSARVWQSSTGQLLSVYFAAAPMNDANFAPDGRSIVAVSDDGRARVWPTCFAGICNGPNKLVHIAIARLRKD